ncbi:MAG: hypothetical protein MJZ19_01480 [Paludibacteraceae bacterium]|nr:hypothetical protein [Paludibacteraceae bacterium]
MSKRIDKDIKDLNYLYILAIIIGISVVSRGNKPIWEWENEWFLVLCGNSMIFLTIFASSLFSKRYYRNSKKFVTVFKIHLYLFLFSMFYICKLWILLGLASVRLLLLARTLIKLYQPQKKYGNGDDLFVEPDGNETTSMTKSEREDSSDENLPILKTRKTMVKKHKNG